MLSRGGWVLAIMAGASFILLAPGTSRAVDELHGESFSTALVGLGTLVQLTLSAWVLLAVGLSLVHAPAPLVRAVSPRLLRRALFAGAVGALAMAPAQADRVSAPSRPAHHDVVGLRLPDRPVAAPPRPAAEPAAVVVRPGDTLWAIAARSLPEGAADAQVARACARWHAANRDVVGDDPDLIFPAQRLTPPLGKDPT
jgi:nucleoid-associated protein YgaU